MTSLDDLATFASIGFLLLVGHNLADHVTGQTDWQAARKRAPMPEAVAAGADPRKGWIANLAHVGAYHLTILLLGVLAWLALPLRWSVAGVVSALAWSSATHALLDRGWPVTWILEHTRSPKFAKTAAGGVNGMYLSDQALHHLALAVASALLTVLR